MSQQPPGERIRVLRELEANSQETTGERIRWLRELYGLTQNQLAELVGINRSTISMIENGHRPGFGSDIARGLALCLDTTTDYILLLTDNSFRPPDDIPEERPDRIARFDRLLEVVPAHRLEEAFDYLREQLRLWADHFALAEERGSEPSRRHQDAPGSVAVSRR